jgi:hypothetical protein
MLDDSGKRASSIGTSRKLATRPISPDKSRFSEAKCSISTLGKSRTSHQLRTFPKNGQNA